MQVLKNPVACSDIFVMVDSVRKMLSARGFSQIPQLTSSVDLLAPGVPKWFIPTEQDLLALARPVTTTQQMQTQIAQAQTVSQATPSNRFKRCFGL
jgi:hypothetical protein